MSRDGAEPGKACQGMLPREQESKPHQGMQHTLHGMLALLCGAVQTVVWPSSPCILGMDWGFGRTGREQLLCYANGNDCSCGSPECRFLVQTAPRPLEEKCCWDRVWQLEPTISLLVRTLTIWSVCYRQPSLLWTAGVLHRWYTMGWNDRKTSGQVTMDSRKDKHPLPSLHKKES